MEILWLNLLIVYLSSSFSRIFAKSNAIEIPYVKPNKILFILSVLTLIFISGLRNNIGDTYFYMHSYAEKQFQLSKIDYSGDFGFNILQAILQSYSKDPQILIFTTAFITNFLIAAVLYKYSRMIEISLFVYITSGLFTVSMNGIRQSLAAAIVFAATKFILEGKFKPFVMIILLASTIHQTALIFIPIYFIVRRKAWTKSTLILLGIGVLIAAEFDQFSNLLFNAIEDTQYSHYKNFSEGGASFMRAAVTFAPLFVAFLGREKLRELWPKSDYIVNLTLLGFVFMLIATKNWIFARFDIYFGLYNLILISWIIKLFSKKDHNFVYYGLLCCYFVYFFYEQVISLGINYKSDYLNW
ncbi:MAG: EpsG family protein [Heyndrickxia sp.]